MSMNEADTRYHLIDPVLRDKGYVSREHVTLETVLTPPPVEPSGPKGRRRKGPGRTDYLLCVRVGDAPKPMPVAVLEAKKEAEDPLKGMQQARGYADTLRFDVKYVFSTNGHRYGEYDRFTELINGPVQFCDFPSHPDLTARYCKDTGIDLTQPGSAMLFQADSAAWSQSRYYQDAAIRASFEKILLDRQAGKPPRVLLTLATGAGKTIIATNLLWRLAQAGQLPKPALFLCDRDELRTQAYNKLSAAFGSNARIVETERGDNAARNARIHIATYQTLGLDDANLGDGGFASFLTDHYSEDVFSVIIIDECHRSAWGRWSEVLRRNPSAIHIGLTATPRKLEESDKASKEDQEITANNRRYFGEPVYEYTLIQAQEDGYLAACEIVKRKASIDSATFTKKEILAAGVRDIKTGKLLTEEDLTKDEYTGKDFDDELLFIELRTPRMCADLSEINRLALRDGDILLTEGGDLDKLGRGACWRGQVPLRVHQNHIFRVCLAADRYEPEYVSFQIGSPYGKAYFLAHAKKTTGIASINQRVLGAFPLFSPPIAEQRRVAAQLKTQLTEVDAARQAAQTRADDIALLRRRVLAEVFAVVEDAPRKRLGDHAPTTSGSTPPRGVKAYWTPAEVPWVKTGEVAFTPIVRAEEAVSRRALAECSLTLLSAGTVLVAMYGQGKTRGQSAILEVAATTNQACFAILPNESWEPGFLFHWLMAGYSDLRELSEGRGGNQANLNGALLNALEVPAPSRAQQAAIARRAQTALRDVEALAAANQAQRAELERLPQRLLAQAFAEDA